MVREEQRHLQEYYYDHKCFAFIGALAYSNAYFGQGTGPILVDNAACVGTETALIQCSQSSTPNCDHSEDAGVRCNPSGQ